MFISSYHDRRRDVIQVWERNENGKRVLKNYKAPYYFYVPNKDGPYEAITGHKLEKVEFSSKREWENELSTHYNDVLKFESDVSPLEKVMMDNYQGKPAPALVVGFLDIEVDYDPKLNWPRPDNPYAPISAITLYRSDLAQYITLAVPPRGMTITPDMNDDTYIMFQQERELLEFFFTLIEDVDILSGWNSEFFDMPYIGKRIELLFGQNSLKVLAFPDGPLPYWGELDRFKNSKEKEIILNLGSRIHLDYLRLFKKFNLDGRQSFSLASIADDELSIPKLSFNKTLYQLYREDFSNFLLYNRRDVEIIVQLDKKFKYIELANRMVHEATVNFNAVYGSVQLIDTAIMNYCHSVFKKILFDKQHRNASGEVEGALVMSPKVGMHKWVGAIDINSLYPSTYRSLNLSPEKIIGQLRNCEADWKAVYDYNLNPINDLLANKILNYTLDNEPNKPDGFNISVKDFVEMIKKEKYALSAHGTILDQSSGEGLIPAVLSSWFKGRKEMQAKKKQFGKRAKEILIENNGDETDKNYIEAKNQEEYYDMLQGVRKVLLNSSYGATLNQFCRFFDKRLGSSTTDSGRQITTHMINTVSKNLIGDNYPKIVKKIITKTKNKRNGTVETTIENEYDVDIPKGLGPMYADTDSCYFTMENMVDNVDDAVVCADAVADAVNASFPEFMQNTFLCQPEFSDLIKANRELVAKSSIFRAKKKYILQVVDKEGTRIPEGHKDEMKTMGSDIKLSSTPEAIRGFLKAVTFMVLKEEDKDKIDQYVLDFRSNFKIEDNTINILDFATVTSVKELDVYYQKWLRIENVGLGRVSMSAGARAVINHNECLKTFNDENTQPIIAGQKIKMIWLNENEYGFTNIGFASEMEILPNWFYENFSPNLKLTEDKLIDMKLKSIFDPIGREIPTPQTVKIGKMFEF